jgi:hypothetical protein
MDSSAFFHSGHKYCRNGGMAFAHRSGAWLGVHQDDDCPFRRSLETTVMQGKVRGSVIHVFRAGMESSASARPPTGAIGVPPRGRRVI